MRTSGVLVVLTGPPEVLAGTRACDDQSSNIYPSGQIRSRNPRGSIRRHRRRGRGPPSLRTLRAERAGDPRKGECCDRQKDKPRDQLAKDDLPDTEQAAVDRHDTRHPARPREGATGNRLAAGSKPPRPQPPAWAPRTYPVVVT